MSEFENFLHTTLNKMGIEMPTFVPELTLVDDLGIESLTRKELAVEIERRFGITVREQLEDLETVGDVAAFLDQAARAA